MTRIFNSQFAACRTLCPQITQIITDLRAFRCLGCFRNKQTNVRADTGVCPYGVGVFKLQRGASEGLEQCLAGHKTMLGGA